MKLLANLLQQAKTSRKHLWFLNRLMRFIVPFNRPHGFRVLAISDEAVKTFAPYRKKNWNHVKGIHACALATVGELAAGLTLMSHFSPLTYRIIMANITIDYHYQAKKDIVATSQFSASLKESLSREIDHAGKVMQTVITELHDTDGQLVATVKTTWQIKPWKTVKTTC